MIRKEHFECICDSDEHRVVFLIWQPTRSDDEPMVWVNIFLLDLPWWKRLWVGAKYILGIRSRLGHFDSAELRPEDAERLRNLADEYIIRRDEYYKWKADK